MTAAVALLMVWADLIAKIVAVRLEQYRDTFSPISNQLEIAPRYFSKVPIVNS